MNEFEQYGSRFAANSTSNEFGTYGSQFGNLFARNPYASRPPVIAKNGSQIAFYTVNQFKSPGVAPESALTCTFPSRVPMLSLRSGRTHRALPCPAILAHMLPLLVACVGLSACASTATGTLISTAAEPAPIPAAGIADTILVMGVDLSTVSTRVGGTYAGLAKVYQGPLTASSEDIRSWGQYINDLTFRRLDSAGYRVRYSSTTFSQVESYQGVRFALAGKVSGLGADYYGAFAGNQTRASLSVTWELYDAASRRVTFTTATTGRSTTSGKSPDAIVVAFRVALSELLADERFLRALAPNKVVVKAAPARLPEGRQIESPTAPVSWRRSLPRESDIIQLAVTDLLPSSGPLLQRASDAVVAIRGSDGHGSAVLLSRDGLAITNHHVVNGQTRLRARTSGGRELAVRVIRSDSTNDLALIEVACTPDCATASLGTTALPGVGTDVYAIGTPVSESLSHSVTKGIVSGLRRRSAVSLIQTDAAVNPGNSGGPLVDASTGSVVGIVTLKIVAEDIEGVAFAIAIADALRVVGVVVR